MPLLIDPPSVAASCRDSALSPFRHRCRCHLRQPPFPPSSSPPPFSPPLRRARNRSRPLAIATRTAEAATRGRLRARDADRMSPLCCALAQPPLLTLSPPRPSLFSVSLFPSLTREWGWFSRGGTPRGHPRKSTAGGRSRTVAPEPQQPATHDPTDRLYPRLGLTPRPFSTPGSATILHPPRRRCAAVSLSLLPLSLSGPLLLRPLSVSLLSRRRAAARPATFGSILLSLPH